MHRIIFLLFSFSLALVLPTAGQAQSAAGKNEFGFSAAFADLSGDDEKGVLVLNLEYGRFLTDALEIGGGILLEGHLDELNEDVEVVAFAQYFFTPEKTTSWYVLAGYIGIFQDSDEGFAGGGFGFRSYLRENVAFSWELDYGISITDAVAGGAIISLAGVSYFF